MQHEWHFHLHSNAVDYKGIEFVAQSLFHSKALESRLVLIMLCRFSHLTCAVRSGIDNHVTICLSFADRRPVNLRSIFKQTFLLQRRDEGRSYLLFRRSGL